MSHTTTNTAITEPTGPADNPPRLGPIICCWVAFDWFLLVMGTVEATTAYVELRDSGTLSPDRFQGLVFGTLGIIFSFVWAIVCFFAYNKRLWAIRAGFYLSFVGFAPFLMLPILPLYQIAADGEFLVLGSTLTFVAAKIILEFTLGHPVNRAVRITYYVICTLFSLIMLWRFNASEHSHDILHLTFPSAYLLWFSVHLLVSYVNTCRTMIKGKKDSGPEKVVTAVCT